LDRTISNPLSSHHHHEFMKQLFNEPPSTPSSLFTPTLSLKLKFAQAECADMSKAFLDLPDEIVHYILGALLHSNMQRIINLSL
jgi:hypothetical protein